MSISIGTTILNTYLRQGLVVSITTDRGAWIIYYENKFPFCQWRRGRVMLLHRHMETHRYHAQSVSAACNVQGISYLLDYIRRHDCEYLGGNKESVALTVLKIEDIMRDLPFQDIQDALLDTLYSEAAISWPSARGLGNELIAPFLRYERHLPPGVLSAAKEAISNALADLDDEVGGTSDTAVDV